MKIFIFIFLGCCCINGTKVLGQSPLKEGDDMVIAEIHFQNNFNNDTVSFFVNDVLVFEELVLKTDDFFDFTNFTVLIIRKSKKEIAFLIKDLRRNIGRKPDDYKDEWFVKKVIIDSLIIKKELQLCVCLKGAKDLSKNETMRRCEKIRLSRGKYIGISRFPAGFPDKFQPEVIVGFHQQKKPFLYY
jgi:hypothetical protein